MDVVGDGGMGRGAWLDVEVLIDSGYGNRALVRCFLHFYRRVRERESRQGSALVWSCEFV